MFNLQLKRASEQDLMLIFDWANDDICRQNSFKTEKIELRQHIDWYENVLKSDNVFLYILYKGKSPIGQIRISTEERTATINYSLDEKYRGQGYGEVILIKLEEEISKEKLPIVCLVAKVKHSNKASKRIFEKLGYSTFDKKDYLEFTKNVSL
jgi:RimJ/RimL family protein N-acetyltransferase